MISSRILVVDDDPIIRKVIDSNLRARHFDVILAEDGKSALQIMEKTQPDLVILDIMMPGIDGIEVCRRIREWSEVPIVFLTARDELYNKLTGFGIGADHYITKPFAVDELVARMRALLWRRGNRATFTKSQNQ
ncbi:response regulator transcription factor [Chloroflexota bacterium]